MENKYPELFQFFGCYFHQDWMCESSDPDVIIRNFISDSAPQSIETVKNELCNLLEMKLSEERIREFLMDEMPCSYCYWLEWESGEIWLKHILNILTISDTYNT